MEPLIITAMEYIDSTGKIHKTNIRELLDAHTVAALNYYFGMRIPDDMASRRIDELESWFIGIKEYVSGVEYSSFIGMFNYNIEIIFGNKELMKRFFLINGRKRYNLYNTLLKLDMLNICTVQYIELEENFTNKISHYDIHIGPYEIATKTLSSGKILLMFIY